MALREKASAARQPSVTARLLSSVWIESGMLPPPNCELKDRVRLDRSLPTPA